MGRRGVKSAVLVPDPVPVLVLVPVPVFVLVLVLVLPVLPLAHPPVLSFQCLHR